LCSNGIDGTHSSGSTIPSCSATVASANILTDIAIRSAGLKHYIFSVRMEPTNPVRHQVPCNTMQYHADPSPHSHVRVRTMQLRLLTHCMCTQCTPCKDPHPAKGPMNPVRRPNSPPLPTPTLHAAFAHTHATRNLPTTTPCATAATPKPYSASADTYNTLNTLPTPTRHWPPLTTSI
jgi:hypothetical protein